MNQYLIFILGIIIGSVLVWLAIKMPEMKKKESLMEKQAREKVANKEAILELLETQGSLTNNQIEKMLGIPESTATRYMDELEKEGKVKQVGDTGTGVYYERLNSISR
jgi:Fic family protein